MKINLSIIMTALMMFSSNSFASASLHNEAEEKPYPIRQIIMHQDRCMSNKMLQSFCAQYKEPTEGVGEKLRQNYYDFIKKSIPSFLADAAHKTSPESFIDAVHHIGTLIRKRALNIIHPNNSNIFLAPNYISNPDTLMQQCFINVICDFSYTLCSINAYTLSTYFDENNG